MGKSRSFRHPNEEQQVIYISVPDGFLATAGALSTRPNTPKLHKMTKEASWQSAPNSSADGVARARQMLTHCRHGLARMQESPSTDWLILLAGTLALLRTATDRDLFNNPETLQKSHDRWFVEIKTNRKNHPIFWEFIKRHRDQLVHKAFENVSISTIVDEVILITGGAPSPPANSSHTYNVAGGYYEGHDVRHKIKDAIDWTDEQLDVIAKGAA